MKSQNPSQNPRKTPSTSKRKDESRMVIQSPFALRTRTLPLKLISPLISSFLKVSQ